MSERPAMKPKRVFQAEGFTVFSQHEPDFADELAGRDAAPRRRSRRAGLAVAVVSVLFTAAAIAGVAAVLALPIAPPKRGDRLPIAAADCRLPTDDCPADPEGRR